jgi:DnaK suppressor protein
MALTPSQVEHYRQLLIARRDELANATARSESAVTDQDDLVQQDSGDRAIADNAKDELLDSAGRDSDELWQIESALVHIKQGKYGICDMCGEEIPKSRLDAVPWALLCVRDQEIADEQRRHDKTRHDKTRHDKTMTGGAPSRVVS